MNEKRIKNIIEKSGIKKSILAKRLKISRPTLDSWILKDEEELYNKVKVALDYDVKEEFSMSTFKEMQKSIIELKAGMFDMQQELKTKDQKIAELQAEVVRLSVENTALGEMLGGKSKMNG